MRDVGPFSSVGKPVRDVQSFSSFEKPLSKGKGNRELENVHLSQMEKEIIVSEQRKTSSLADGMNKKKKDRKKIAPSNPVVCKTTKTGARFGFTGPVSHNDSIWDWILLMTCRAFKP